MSDNPRLASMSDAQAKLLALYVQRCGPVPDGQLDRLLDELGVPSSEPVVRLDTVDAEVFMSQVRRKAEPAFVAAKGTPLRAADVEDEFRRRNRVPRHVPVTWRYDRARHGWMLSAEWDEPVRI